MGVGTETSWELRVRDVVPETGDASSIVLDVPAGAEEAFAYRPGQFLTVAVPSERDGLAARCYSLSSSPADGGPLTITVKRTAEGYASNWLLDHVRPGSTLRVLPPSGIFSPKDLDADLLLLAAGSGITPIISIARTALARGTGRVVLLYANRDEQSVIFAAALDALAREHPDRLRVLHWLESLQGLPDPAQLRALAADHATYDAFVCGPGPFMKAVTGVLKELGFPRDRRHQEKFVSLGGNPFGDVPPGRVEAEVQVEDEAAAQPADRPAAPAPGERGPARVEVLLDGVTSVFDDWGRDTTLLELLESKGLDAPYSCREGECSACAYRLDEGEVVLRRNEVLDDVDLAAGIRLGCQSLPVSDRLRVTYL